MVKLTVAALALTIASSAGAAGWRSLRIDGSSESAFSQSVAALRDKLPPAHQFVFNSALQDIWALGTQLAESEQREYAAAEYFRQLDGLTYKDVVTFTDPTGRTALERYRQGYALVRRHVPRGFASPGSPWPEHPPMIGFSGEQVRGIDNQAQAIQQRLSQ